MQMQLLDCSVPHGNLHHVSDNGSIYQKSSRKWVWQWCIILWKWSHMASILTALTSIVLFIPPVNRSGPCNTPATQMDCKCHLLLVCTHHSTNLTNTMHAAKLDQVFAASQLLLYHVQLVLMVLMFARCYSSLLAFLCQTNIFRLCCKHWSAILASCWLAISQLVLSNSPSVVAPLRNMINISIIT